ncbi:MAG: DUF1569 domain-containing protein [Pirellulales bacterium]|nr:DUF1569 domain-containing protein [Pirellulales bacterium]
MPRRSLQFQGLNDAIDDIRLLQRVGYERRGNWSLGQICDHLAIFFRGSLDGFDTKFPWIVRATVGKFVLRRIFEAGKMRTGVKVPKRFLPAGVRADAVAADELVELIDRFGRKSEPLEPSPIFGPLTKEEWTKLHLIHCAHHLRFLMPK